MSEDARWMARALELAARGWGRVAPNPLVGAVIVRDGVAVGEGWHTEYGQPHAEAEALRAAGEAARGATAYVTLEPCSHFAKTPPCTDGLLAAGVRRVVFAAHDPNPRAAGGGEVLRAAGVEVLGGVMEAEARDQNALFFHAHSNSARPFVALKLALTLDGRIADHAGSSVWITGEGARAEVHRLRAGFDAVAVGSGTALADDPRLTVRGPVEPRVPPTRVVFDRTLRLPLASRLVGTAREVPVTVVAGSDPPAESAAALGLHGVRVLVSTGIHDGLLALRESGIGSVFVEGGAKLASALLNADVVDRLYLFYAPLFLGPGGVGAFAELDTVEIGAAHRWRRLRTETFGADTLITLARHTGG
ncbi:MAG: Diaminohydroxyphosphoribosylaminopyrimidine deaminase / 5-amino-6-(5-phosphoribosylamino)uracil reductase [uncultured Gemmatimonadetes bacterium]|uniref:Riboflavin biosynthesis protein RibD n=1 Tax=uncultured Gemmatimonadota bacterium TaxID=203437 RepID=A0A6J4LZK1_9BACT|nr:MAG: Diaminohydroxyphosphoribosylaminopyrimidine deaminase / 5-amino-6-(5-phosphoribosylamino)uracil reductase [uncultured Gemmatimonadota bacterium]